MKNRVPLKSTIVIKRLIKLMVSLKMYNKKSIWSEEDSIIEVE